MSILQFMWIAIYLTGAFIDYQTHTSSYLESLFAVLPVFIIGLVPVLIVYFIFMKSKWVWHDVLNTASGVMLVWILSVSLFSINIFPDDYKASQSVGEISVRQDEHDNISPGKDYDTLKKAAEQGHDEAQAILGARYFLGIEVHQNYIQASKWLKKAAHQNNADAQASLGLMYKDGIGVPQDYAQSAKWFRKAAEQGNAESQTELGSMYKHGQGVLQDYEEALKWYRRAAEQGSAPAKLNLGTMYHRGQGVPQNYDLASKWIRKAAEQGVVTAQWNLGARYYKGLGVTQDYIRAHKWWNLAASQGNEEARELLNMISENMTSAQIAEAQRLAREWMERH